MKKLLSYLFTFALLLSLVFGVSVTAVAATSRVIDDAGLFSASETQKIESMAENISAKYKLDVVVLTTEEISLTGISDWEFEHRLMNFADDYYDYHGYANNGFLLLVAVDSSEVGFWISTKGKCIKYFSEEDFYYLTEEYSDNIRYYGESHGEAVLETLSGCKSVIKNYKRVGVVFYLIAIGIGVFVAARKTGKLQRELKSVRFQPVATDYMRENSFSLTRANDVFLYRNVSRIRIERNTSSRSGGGGHTSSSGSHHGGGGGRV